METHYEMMHRAMFGDTSRSRAFIEEVAKTDINKAWTTIPMVMHGYRINNELDEIITRKVSAESQKREAMLQKYALVEWVLDNQTEPYSFSELLLNPNFRSLSTFLAEVTGDPGGVMVTLQLLHHMVCHARAGKRVYEVSEGLGEMLRHTELRGVTTDDLRLPYEAIYVQIPKSADVKIWNKETGWHRAIGAYVCEENQMDELDQYEYDQMPSRPKYRGWRMMMVGESKRERGLAGDDALSFFRVVLKPGGSLPELLDRCKKDIERELHNPYSTWDDKQSLDWISHFFWVMNVVLYATFEEPGEKWESNQELRKLWERARKAPKGSTKRKKLNQRARQLSSQPRILLGHKIVVRRTASDQAESGSLESRKNNSRLLYVKTRVPGHWRRVVHGPGRSLRRRQWIQPYWKHKEGEDAAEQPRHELR